ncbi:DUF3040 domain-containing protein [Sphaerisporangium sp. TRM90804]|uniref:DUF3040 domain-containing protein n=1 Tax=Sphaerisporangium sp. TRM90804 TaxID=3031113 RepID=UPI00244BD183|nr:DUF3040 domain-containing protein [Sphaerisporangium sp. TRM90804]MDH2426190.1 DUF3040 domain-containing protein [Sphaerisporangium sp. TRM90804]
MPWSQDEQRVLAQIERYLCDDDPRLAARLESFNEELERKEVDRQRAALPEPAPRRLSRSTIIILVSWVLIATLVATLLIMVFQHDATLPM